MLMGLGIKRELFRALLQNLKASKFRYNLNSISINEQTFTYHDSGMLKNVLIEDSAGSLKNDYEYDAFGNTVESGSMLNEVEFTSAISDDNTGLYYMNADRF